ncbi:universal stress protein [Halomarina litorea]|uniref:universal stress protein n=1 Tax=Halomarina litorea TaxID=2961595 RepID=UPI0020C44AEB|nr:universal stress protein [Halomarina sp. BCD28]
MSGLLANVLVPVANVEDARSTAAALARYDPDRVTVIHVVEKGGGAPDKTPVEQSEGIAAESFDAFRETFPDAATEMRYDDDIVGAVFDAAREMDASAVVFLPRGGSRWVQLLSGDRTLALVTETDRPVVALPGGADA